MPGISSFCMFLLIVSVCGQQNQTDFGQVCLVTNCNMFYGTSNASFVGNPLKTFASTCIKYQKFAEEFKEIQLSEINSAFFSAQNIKKGRNKRSKIRRRQLKDRDFAKGRIRQRNSRRTRSKEVVILANCDQQLASIRDLRYPVSSVNLDVQKKMTNQYDHVSTGGNSRKVRRKSSRKRLIKERRRGVRLFESAKGEGRRQRRILQRQTTSPRISRLDKSSEVLSSFRFLSRNVDTRRARTTRRRNRRQVTGRRDRLQFRVKEKKAYTYGNSFTSRKCKRREKKYLRTSRNRVRNKSLARRGGRRRKKSERTTAKGNIHFGSNRQSNKKGCSSESELLRKLPLSSKSKNSKRRKRLSSQRVSNRRLETATTGVVTGKELLTSNNINSFYKKQFGKGNRRFKNRKRHRKQALRRRRNRINHSEISSNKIQNNLDFIKVSDSFDERSILQLYLPTRRISIKRFPHQIHRNNMNIVPDGAKLIKQTGADIKVAKESTRSKPFGQPGGHILGILGLLIWMTSRSTSA